MRAAPLAHPRARVCVTLRPSDGAERDAVLRAAHDLKAPLHAIAGFGALLEREQLGPLSAQQRQALATLVGETDRLTASLGALVERVQTGDATDTTDHASHGIPAGCAAAATASMVTDLGTVARRTAQRFAPLAATTGVKLETEDEALSAALSEQDAATILDNLVANALAAGPTRMRIALACQSADGGGQATLRVEDDGPGVPEEMLERVFAPRVRLADRGASGGSGLGLTIARALAQRAGGTLTAARRPGGGAVFTLRVPLAAEAAPRVLRVAPVTTHTALARVSAALDAAGAWRHAGWEGGVLAVQVGNGDAQTLAARLGREGLACW